MIPNVLAFQPEAAPAVLPSGGRGAAAPASDSGSFAGLLQVKLPGQGDSPASAKGTDGGSAQPAFSANALFPTDNGANTTADAAALFAEADSVAPNLTGAPQTIPQFAMGKGNQLGFPTGNIAGLTPQEVAMDLATSGAVVASEAAATPALQQGKDAAPSAAASKQTDQETPSAAADTAAPSPQIAALAAAAMVAATTTMTAAQPADPQGSEPVAAVSTSAAPLPASLQATATTGLSSQAMADAVLPQPEGANAGANQNPMGTQPNSQMNPVAGTPAGGSAAGGAVAPEMAPVNSGAQAAQAGLASNPVQEQGASFREERSAHMVRVLYGTGYHAKTDPKEDAAQQQTTAELRETGVQAQRPDTKTGVTEKTAPVSAEATPSNTVQAQVVKPQASVAGPTLPGTVTVRQEADAQAAQPAQSGAAADATGGITSAKGSIRDNGTAAAAGTVQQGELKAEGRGAEQPQVKVVEGGAPNATVKAETGRNGGFADPERKEQDQKAPAKEGTQQVQQPLGMGTAQQAPAEAKAPETKSAATTTALHESILSQIKDGAVVHDGKGNGQINIRLNPNDLGELKIQVRMDSSNNVRVEVQADNKMVKDLLLSNVQSLKETLAAKNFTMDGFDVSTGSQGGFNNPLKDDQANAWQQQRPATRSASLVSYADDVEPARVNYLTGDVNNLLSVRL